MKKKPINSTKRNKKRVVSENRFFNNDVMDVANVIKRSNVNDVNPKLRLLDAYCVIRDGGREFCVLVYHSRLGTNVECAFVDDDGYASSYFHDVCWSLFGGHRYDDSMDEHFRVTRQRGKKSYGGTATIYGYDDLDMLRDMRRNLIMQNDNMFTELDMFVNLLMKGDKETLMDFADRMNGHYVFRLV